MQGYEYRHVIGFEETNLIGNVYFVNHIRWQGRCRELFLRDHAPGVLAEMERGLTLVTTRVACEYFEELAALDEITIRMTLVSQVQNRLTMAFAYYRAATAATSWWHAASSRSPACAARARRWSRLRSLRNFATPSVRSLPTRIERTRALHEGVAHTTALACRVHDRSENAQEPCTWEQVKEQVWRPPLDSSSSI